MYSQTKGVISKPFSNPAKDRTASSIWLLTYCIFKLKEKGGQLKQVEDVLGKSLKQVRSQDKSFFIMWSSDYDLKDMLQRLTEIGILDETIDEKSEEPIWRINSEGKKLLHERKKHAPLGISLRSA